MVKFNPKTKSYEYESTEYPAQCIRVIDGDTAYLLVDKGLRGFEAESFRIRGINAPEMHDKDPAVRLKAQAAKQGLENLLGTEQPLGKWDLRIIVYQDQTFARWVADIFTVNVHTGKEIDVAATMIQLGFAVPMTP